MEDITLEWKGEEYIVEARNVLPMIAKIEEHITLAEIVDAAQRGTVHLARLSMAYGAALRHAGARVTNDEVYSGMFSTRSQSAATEAIETLLALMVPPEHLRESEPRKKKAVPREAPPGSSSRKRTKRQSPGGSRRTNSGE